MTKIIFKPLLAVGLLLGGCTLGSCTSAGALTTLTVASFEQALKNACQLELPVATAAADVAAFVPVIGSIVGGVAALANEVCTAVAALPPAVGYAAGVGAPVTVIVRGVPIHVARHS